MHRDMTKGFEPNVAVSREELSELRTLVTNFHAVKNIRAWAAEENVETRRALCARLDELLDRQA